jgi:hypothetical protein
MRAAVATLFNLEVVQVPHFILFNDCMWVFMKFLESIGWDYDATCWPHYSDGSKLSPEELVKKIAKYPGVDGYHYASVKSRTFEGVNYAVIIDGQGLVVHDPNPNKAWLGQNVVQLQTINYWYVFTKRIEK